MNKHTGSTLDEFLDECGIEPLKINDCCHKMIEVYESRIALLMEGKDAEIKRLQDVSIAVAAESYAKVKSMDARLTKAMELLDKLIGHAWWRTHGHVPTENREQAQRDVDAARVFIQAFKKEGGE